MSGNFIAVKVDMRRIDKVLGTVKSQAPFVVALLATYSVQDAAPVVQRKLPEQFTIRRPWTQKGIRWQKATKRNPTAIVGSRDYYMALQETGGLRKPRDSKRLAVPVAIRKDPSKNITKARRPKALLSGGRVRGKKPYIAKTRKGEEGIFISTGSRQRGGVSMLYHLRRKPISVKRRPWLFKPVIDTIGARLQRNLDRAMGFALRTAR